MDPCAALLGPYSPSKRVFIVIAAAGEAVQWQRGSCAGMPRPLPARAALLPGLCLRPGKAPSQLFPGSVPLPEQPTEPPGRLPAEAASWQVFKR